MGNFNFQKTCDQLTSYFRNRDDVLLVILFGSHGTPNEHEMSDIDIAILLDKQLPLFEELKLSAEVSVVLERDDVDLVMLRDAPVNIAHRVLSTGKVIVERDRIKIADFIEETLNEYRDYGYRLKQLDREFDDVLREGYYHDR